MKILVDTNLIVRFSDPADQQHPIAIRSLELLAQQGHELRLVPQIIYEYWVVATRPIENNGLGFSVEQLDVCLKDIVALFPLLHDERLIFRNWMQLVLKYNVRGKRSHDVRIIAAMQRHTITHLLTFNDQDFSSFTGISVLTPDKVVAPNS